MKTKLLFLFILMQTMAMAQHSQMYPDSVSSNRFVGDTLHVDKAITDSLVSKSVTAKRYFISPLNSNENNLPVFIRQDSTVGGFSTKADSFAIAVPGAAFRPEHFDRNPSEIEPDYYAQAMPFQNGFVWGIDGFYSLIAPFSIGLNHERNNIRLKEFEVCGWDSNSEMDLLALLHETYFVGVIQTDTVRMHTRSNGGGAFNRGCWKTDVSIGDTDNFNLNQSEKNYWIEIIPVKKTYTYDFEDPPIHSEFGSWPPLNNNTPVSPTGILRLMNVRFFYSYK